MCKELGVVGLVDDNPAYIHDVVVDGGLKVGCRSPRPLLFSLVGSFSPRCTQGVLFNWGGEYAWSAAEPLPQGSQHAHSWDEVAEHLREWKREHEASSSTAGEGKD